MKAARGIGFLLILMAPLEPAFGAQQSAPAPSAPARQEHGAGQAAAKTGRGGDATRTEDAHQLSLILTEHKDGQITITKVFASGTKFRMEPLQSKTVGNPQGIYALTLDRGRTVYTFNPETREFTKADSEELMTQVTEKWQSVSKEMGLKIEDPKVETVQTEAGQPLDGHPTQHYRVRVSYTMYFTKSKVRQPYVEYQDLWMASDMERTGAPDILIYFRATGDPRIDDAWKQEVAQMPGFPLRQVTLRTEVREDGNSVVTRYARDISEVQKGPLPDSLFKFPTGYKEVAGKTEDQASN